MCTPLPFSLLNAGVRKHARKTHLAWLKSVDENAGSRDRHLESKPSTYCVKEEGYDFGPEDLDEHELSPQLSPTLMGNLRVCSPDARGQYGSGSLSASPNQSGQTSPTGFALPEPVAQSALNQQQFGGVLPQHTNAREMSGMMAAAVAAALNGTGPPPPPLAFLLAQNAMLGAAAASGAVPPPPPIPVSEAAANIQNAFAAGAMHPTPQHPIAQSLLANPVSLSVPLGQMPPNMNPWAGLMAPPVPPPSFPTDLPTNSLSTGPAFNVNDPSLSTTPPPLLDGLTNGVGVDPRLSFDPLPPPATFEQLSRLFENPSGDVAGANPDPLCLTPPQPSQTTLPVRVSPFELDNKRPKAQVVGVPLGDNGASQTTGVGGGMAAPQMKSGGGSHGNLSGMAHMTTSQPFNPFEMSPTSTTTPFGDNASSLLGGHHATNVSGDDIDEPLPSMKEAEYKAFVETLLAM